VRRHSDVQLSFYTTYRSRYSAIIPNYRFNRYCSLQVPRVWHACCEVRKGTTRRHGNEPCVIMVDSRATTGFPEATAFLTCSLTQTSELICRFVRIIPEARRVGRIIEGSGFVNFRAKPDVDL
jgi:hypothetical protein